MATYIAEADSYAGFGSTGKYFGYFGLAAGTLGLTGWAAMHGHLPGLQPADATDQLLLVAMQWIGTGLFVIMAVAVLGSLMLSSKSRGIVILDDLGVTRRIGERSRMLRWPEIEGFVVTPIRAGITLIPREGSQVIEIPRFLDDYRGCIAEIKARGVGSLPASRLKQKRGKIATYGAVLMILAIPTFLFHRSWEQSVSVLGVFGGLLAWNVGRPRLYKVLAPKHPLAAKVGPELLFAVLGIWGIKARICGEKSYLWMEICIAITLVFSVVVAFSHFRDKLAAAQADEEVRN